VGGNVPLQSAAEEVLVTASPIVGDLEVVGGAAGGEITRVFGDSLFSGSSRTSGPLFATTVISPTLSEHGPKLPADSVGVAFAGWMRT
jgi:hypothetical protein